MHSRWESLKSQSKEEPLDVLKAQLASNVSTLLFKRNATQMLLKTATVLYLTQSQRFAGSQEFKFISTNSNKVKNKPPSLPLKNPNVI